MEISVKKFPVWFTMEISRNFPRKGRIPFKKPWKFLIRNFLFGIERLWALSHMFPGTTTWRWLTQFPYFFVSSQPYAKVHMFPGTTTGRWLTQFPYFLCFYIFNFFFGFLIFWYFILLNFFWVLIIYFTVFLCTMRDHSFPFYLFKCCPGVVRPLPNI